MANDLLIKIGASAKQFQEEMDAVKETTEDLKGQLESVGKVAAAAFAATSAAIGFSVHEFAEAEKSALKTNAILKATGGISGVTAEQVKKLADSFQQTTAFGDDLVRDGENILLTFTHIGAEVFPQATEAMLDLATKMGTDASSAAQQLGRALDDPIRGITLLQRQGIVFSEVQQKQIASMVQTNNIAGAQKIILDSLSNSIGGLAKESAAGVSGSFSKLKNSFSDIGEEIGARFAPLIKEAADKLREFFDYVKSSPRLLDALTNGLKAAFVLSGAVAAITAIGLAALALGPAFVAAGTALSVLTGPLGVFLAIGAAIGVAVDAVRTLKNESENKQSAPQKTQNLVTDSKRSEDLAATEERKNEEQKKRQEAQLKLINQQTTEYNALKLGIERDGINNSLLALQGYSSEYLSLSAELNANSLAMATEFDSVKKQLMEEKQAELLELIAEENENIKGSEAFLQEELQSMEDEYHLQKIDKQSALYKRLQNEARKHFQSEKQLQVQFISEQMAKDAANKKARYADEQKFGKTMGALMSSLREAEQSDIGQFMKSAVAMQKSQNQTLKTIGKAAALTQIAIDTARGAMSAYNAFAFIPLVGPALGLAAAAAVIAFGVEQAGAVTAAQTGGLVMGGTPGQDSVPFMLEPGELIVPRANFEEVVGSVSSARNPDDAGGGGGGSAGRVMVDISFSGDASRMLTARQIEDKRLGVSRNPNA